MSQKSCPPRPDASPADALGDTRDGAPAPRPAVAGDLAAIGALVRAAYTPWIARIGAVPAPLSEGFDDAVAAGRASVVDADPGPDGAPGLAAMIVLVRQPDALLLQTIAVAPAFQGRGLGRRLLALAEARARADGLPRLRLYTHERMASNLALYRRAGFVETHRATEHGLRRVYMEKSLGPT